MKRNITAAAMVTLGMFTLSGCATVEGAAIGGVAGAGVAAVSGHNVKKGAVIGAGAGAAIGTIAH